MAHPVELCIHDRDKTTKQDFHILLNNNIKGPFLPWSLIPDQEDQQEEQI